jgi:hypothetical protein
VAGFRAFVLIPFLAIEVSSPIRGNRLRSYGGPLNRHS